MKFLDIETIVDKYFGIFFWLQLQKIHILTQILKDSQTEFWGVRKVTLLAFRSAILAFPKEKTVKFQ